MTMHTISSFQEVLPSDLRNKEEFLFLFIIIYALKIQA